MSKNSETLPSSPLCPEMVKEAQKSLQEAWTSKLVDSGPPYTDLTRKIAEESKNPLEDSSVKNKIEKFEMHQKRKAEESPKSPETKPRVTKVARKKKVKRKLNQTQLMLTNINAGNMKAFRKMNNKLEDNTEKLDQIEKKTQENSSKLENLEKKSDKNETRIEKLEESIPTQVKTQINKSNCFRTV